MSKKVSISASVAGALKGGKSFDLSSFKAKKNLSQVKFKPQTWIPLSKAFNDILQLPGIPIGHISILRGHSDSGKTTSMIEAAVSAQKMGILPIFIITEMKWNWEHAIKMGLKVEEVYDEDSGELIDYSGDFIYIDRGSLNTIEDVAAFISDILDEQKKGRLPYNLLFMWDSVGSIPCEMVIEKGKVANEWNAGAIAQQFGNFINQQFTLSRKETSPFTNTFIVVNKVWVQRPKLPMEQPKIRNKGGDTMFFDSSLVLTFGGIENSGTNKIKAVSNKKTVEYAKRTKISCDKNHITGIQCRGNIIMTPHGFIFDSKDSIDSYKDEHLDELMQLLGTDNFSLIEESEDSSVIEYSE